MPTYPKEWGGTDSQRREAGVKVGGGGTVTSTPSGWEPGTAPPSPPRSSTPSTSPTPTGGSSPFQPDRPGEAKTKMIEAGVMTPAGVMKDITGYYKDPASGTYKFVAKGEPLRVPTKPATTATSQQVALDRFLSTQTAAHEAQQRADRTRTLDFKSMTVPEKVAVGQQMFHAISDRRGRIREMTLSQQKKPYPLTSMPDMPLSQQPEPTPTTKTRTEEFTTRMWGGEASEQIA